MILILQVVIASGTGTTAYFLARHFHSSSNAAQLKNDPPHPFATPPLQPKQSNIAAEVATSSSSRMRLDVEVLAVPCVGSKAHLEVQMQQLHTLCGGGNYHGPTVLSTDCAPRRVFAKPCAEHLAIWRALREETGIEFDLIYAPRTFEIMLSHCQDQGGSNAGEFGSLKDWMPGVNILYYHCGGVEGNESQLLRYGKMKS